jgi:integrase
MVEFIGWQPKKKARAANSIRRDLTCLQRIFRRCVERGEMANNPCIHPDVRDARPQSVKHERAFTADEVESFLQVCSTRNKSPKAQDYAEYFLLLAETGLRLEEGRMQRLCDIHLSHDGRDYLRVEPHSGWSPKTAASIRRVPLTPRAAAMVRSRIKRLERFDPSARLFPATWTNRSVDQCFLRVLRRCELDAPDDRHGQTLTVHSLRHYYATRLVQSGADPATVRDLLGHSSITTTNRYFNVPRAELFTAVMGAFGSASPKTSPNQSVPIGSHRRNVRNIAETDPQRIAQNP